MKEWWKAKNYKPKKLEDGICMYRNCKKKARQDSRFCCLKHNIIN